MDFFLLASEVWPGNWEQFLSGLVATIIGTVIGIFGPFWLQARHDKKDKQKRAMDNLKKVKEELEGVVNQFAGLSADLYISPIKIPEWNGLINTNEIELFSFIKFNKQNIKDAKGWIKQIFKIYDLIEEYNQWWNIYTDKAVGGRTRDELAPVKDCMRKLQAKLCSKDANNDECINYVVDLINLLTQTKK